MFFERERKWQTLSALCCHAAAAAACTHTSHLPPSAVRPSLSPPAHLLEQADALRERVNAAVVLALERLDVKRAAAAAAAASGVLRACGVWGGRGVLACN